MQRTSPTLAVALLLASCAGSPTAHSSDPNVSSDITANQSTFVDTDDDGLPDAKTLSAGAAHTETLDANKALARKWFDEVINQRNLDAIDKYYATNYVHHGPDGAELRGTAATREFAAAILAASSDRHAVVEQQIAEGDLVVTRFTSRGMHTGPFRGIEPTGRPWVTEGICISRIQNGKIVEDWEIIHNSGM